MKNYLTKLIITIIAVIGVTTGLTTVPTYADTSCNNICCSDASDEVKAASGCGGSTTNLTDAVMFIINGILSILAVVAVIVIVIGGVQYMTSTGDPGKTKKAKDTILYACIGLIIVALAAVIVNFVISVIPNGSAPTP